MVAEAEDDESVLVVGVMVVRTQQGIFVQEHCPRFLEGHTVLSAVRSRLPLVPFEAKPTHACLSVPTV
jgi:hypothetical protein